MPRSGGTTQFRQQKALQRRAMHHLSLLILYNPLLGSVGGKKYPREVLYHIKMLNRLSSPGDIVAAMSTQELKHN